MAARYKRKTKNFFIKRDLQGRMILAIFVTAIGGSLLFLLLLAFFSSDTISISYANSSVQVGETTWVLFKSAVAANWLFLVIGGTLLVAATMVGSHRIAGPLFRFERTLDAMVEGNLADTIHLRGKDEGQELAAKLNDFNSMLSTKLHAVDRHTEAINDLLCRFDRLTEGARLDDAESIYRAIRLHNDKIRTQIGHFTLGNDQ